jgi:hypothetical protein
LVGKDEIIEKDQALLRLTLIKALELPAGRSGITLKAEEVMAK